MTLKEFMDVCRSPCMDIYVHYDNQADVRGDLDEEIETEIRSCKNGDYIRILLYRNEHDVRDKVAEKFGSCRVLSLGVVDDIGTDTIGVSVIKETG